MTNRALLRTVGFYAGGPLAFIGVMLVVAWFAGW
jgi:hypothetical protein